VPKKEKNSRNPFVLNATFSANFDATYSKDPILLYWHSTFLFLKIFILT
jgi:hypothetical protein